MATLAELLMKKIFSGLSVEELHSFDIAANKFVKKILEVKRVADSIAENITTSVTQLKIEHECASLLQVYRRRHSWKKADLRHLETYPLSATARNRLARIRALKSRGRGTIPPFQSMDKRLISMGEFLIKLNDPETSEKERLNMLKQTRWWPEFVEMTYRGEYFRLRELGVAAPSEEAEKAVGKICNLSPERIRQLCGPVRKDADSGVPMSAPMEAVDLKNWKKTGRLPEVDEIKLT